MTFVRGMVAVGVAIVLTMSMLTVAIAEEMTQEDCAVYANFSMDVAKLRDKGAPANVVYEAAVVKVGLPRDLVLYTIANIYQSGRGLTPEQVGAVSYNTCLENVPTY